MNKKPEMSRRGLEVPLMEAAAVLGLSYNQTLRLVLIGRLAGRKIDGHWLVDPADLERARHERRAILRAAMHEN